MKLFPPTEQTKIVIFYTITYGIYAFIIGFFIALLVFFAIAAIISLMVEPNTPPPTWVNVLMPILYFGTHGLIILLGANMGIRKGIQISQSPEYKLATPSAMLHLFISFIALMVFIVILLITSSQ